MNGYQIVSESLRNTVKMFHITNPKNKQSIEKNGLKISYADVTGKGNLFSIPKWWLHTNISAIYLVKDLNIDIDSTESNVPSNPLVIECVVPLNQLRLDEDDLKWIHAGHILSALGYKNAVPKNYVGWDFDKIRNNKRLLDDLENTYQNPKNIASQMKIDEKIIKAITINIIVSITKKSNIQIRKIYREGMLLAIEDSKQYVKRFFNHSIKGDRSYISIKDISPEMIDKMYLKDK